MLLHYVVILQTDNTKLAIQVPSISPLYSDRTKYSLLN